MDKRKSGNGAMIFVAPIDATEDINDQIMGFIIPTPLVSRVGISLSCLDTIFPVNQCLNMIRSDTTASADNICP